MSEELFFRQLSIFMQAGFIINTFCHHIHKIILLIFSSIKPLIDLFVMQSVLVICIKISSWWSQDFLIMVCKIVFWYLFYHLKRPIPCDKIHLFDFWKGIVHISCHILVIYLWWFINFDSPLLTPIRNTSPAV